MMLAMLKMTMLEMMMQLMKMILTWLLLVMSSDLEKHVHVLGVAAIQPVLNEVIFEVFNFFFFKYEIFFSVLYSFLNIFFRKMCNGSSCIDKLPEYWIIVIITLETFLVNLCFECFF